ncbi:MAG: UPF0280 family protein [Methanoregulaceae archaeon]|jgi:hypothetical protein|nr:UPF0280 family protein [Methanoregulaceae archaeon]
MIRHHFELRETIATILADEQSHIDAAVEGLIEARQVVERYIAGDPFFRSTFEPYTPESDDLVITRMAHASEKAGVGPMAAVAGAIAWSGIEAMYKAGAAYGVIDNGGDIALFSDHELLIGVHAGNSPFSDRVAFAVPPTAEILGICTSSATVGPSISFGTADSVTVFSHDVALADAWATAVCNEIRPDDTSVLLRINQEEVRGVFSIIGEWTSSYGILPPLVRAYVRKDLITAGRN